jgi:acetylornithine/succinyldiaminopimelate/putrescine aminotransferase
VARKHAEFDRVLKVQALTAEITAHIDNARSAVRSGEATVPGDSLRAVGASSGADAAKSFEILVTELVRRNAEQASRPPVFLTLEGSIHGKLAGSVQLTHNASYRQPFSAMAAQPASCPSSNRGPWPS